jgi:hypothetical protein
MYMQYILVIDKTSLNPSTFYWSTCVKQWKWAVMYVFQAMKVSGHVCVSSNESERSCMCVKQWKWAVMYVCQAMKVSRHVCVSSNDSERSCMYVKQWKWAVMYVCQAMKVSGRVFVSRVSIVPASMIFILDFGTVLTLWYFLFCFCFCFF